MRRALEADEGKARSEQTFLLGAGCQRGGTSWLYRYLKASPQFAAGYRKEYHVFDTLDVPDQTYMRNRILTLAEEALAAARRGDPADGEVLHRASMFAKPRFYFDYFESLLLRTAGARATGDMTPETALLGTERLTNIREQFERRGIRTAAVFLMRDPVDRVWSQIRMQHQRTPDRFAESPEQSLLRLHADPSYATRTAYDEIVTRLDSVFASHDIAYAFYEELFEEQTLRRICDTLGLEAHEPELTRRVNASLPKQGTLPDEIALQVARHYRGVYEFVARRFEVDLDRLWPFSSYLR